MKCSSNPNSELNMHRRSVHVAADCLRMANMGYGSKSEAMAMLNRARTSLRHFVKGKTARYIADFTASIQGIPCSIRIIRYQPEEPAVTWRAIEYCHPGAPAEVEFEVLDMKGYPAAWLERKMTDEDREEIEIRSDQWYNSRNYEDESWEQVG